MRASLTRVKPWRRRGREKKRDSMEFDLFLCRERKRNRIDAMIDPGGGSIEGEGNSSEREE